MGKGEGGWGGGEGRGNGVMHTHTQQRKLMHNSVWSRSPRLTQDGRDVPVDADTYGMREERVAATAYSSARRWCGSPFGTAIWGTSQLEEGSPRSKPVVAISDGLEHLRRSNGGTVS